MADTTAAEPATAPAPAAENETSTTAPAPAPAPAPANDATAVAPALPKPEGETLCEVCSEPSKLTCPKCKALGLPPAFYCGKKCFPSAWPVHKKLHKKNKPKPDPRLQLFDRYSFTGPLRPFPMTAQVRKLPKSIDVPDYAVTGIPVSEDSARSSRSIEIKTPEQIEALRRVCKLGREVLDIASAAIKVGVTADAIDKVVLKACIERNCYPSPLNYRRFPKAVCVSVNEVICHGIPDMRPLQDGDIVNLDVTVFKEGVHADLNETFLVGNVDEDSVALVKTAYECLRAAVRLVKPKEFYRNLGTPIEKVARQNKCSVVTSYCGHGIGTLFHTSPNVPHYRRNKAIGKMKPGHVFTIEPMINRGRSSDQTWPDNWTSVTRDGKRSAQFEHTMLVTENGVELLTARVGAPSTHMPPFDPKVYQR